MGVIHRQDGVAFVTQAYREQLNTMRQSVLLHEFRLLSEQNGEYACLRKQQKHTLEVAFGAESGYLLGETVWHFFKKPSHLIYVEGMANSAQLIVVIVREGNVYFDAKITSSQLKNELLPLMSEEQAYEIITYGDVPLRESETFGGATFTLPNKMIATFIVLDKPLFPVLPIFDEYQLKPVNLMEKSQVFHQKRRWFASTVVVLFIACMGWWIFKPHQQAQILSQAPSGGSASDIMLTAALSTPDPASQMEELMRKIDELYLIPGWKIAHLHYTGEKYTVDLHSMGGSLWYLTDWAKQHYYDLQILPKGVQLELHSVLPKRQRVRSTERVQTALENVMERMHKVLPIDAVRVETREQHGSWHETKLVIQLQALSPELLDLIGQELSDLPIVLSSINLNVNNGLIDGQMYVSVWGT